MMELALFAFLATYIKVFIISLHDMDGVMYYWFCFNILTALWEYVYVIYYEQIASYADNLVEQNKSVWTEPFPLIFVSPNLLSIIFYAEYGAHADREYMSERKGDYWSRLIESSHAFCCGAFSLASLALYVYGDQTKSYYAGMAGMGCQFMNSVLYMGQYILQCRNPWSPNFNSVDFPLGKWMSKRLFMWINIFWTIMPSIIILRCLVVG